MVMRWLIQEWVCQWLGLRDRLRAAAERDAWWLEMRERILRFLVSRYVQDSAADVDVAAAIREARERAGDPAPTPRTFCRVQPEDHPPRRCADMTARLHSVTRINAAKRARWRWI